MRSSKIDSVVSIGFLAWLAATVLVYTFSPAALRRYVAMLSTVVVLLAADPRSLLCLVAMTAVVCLAIRAKQQMAALLGACALILLALLAFKLLESTAPTTSLFDRIVPLGLSYYSLRCIHVLVERYLDRIAQPTDAQVLDYLFFPATIIAGPIHRFPAFVAEDDSRQAFANASAAEDSSRQSFTSTSVAENSSRQSFANASVAEVSARQSFANASVAEDSSRQSFANWSEGLERILYGYVKIVVLSNYLLSVQVFPWLYANVDASSALFQYLDALDYGLTLYLQFSGYSDIAIGFALLLGHRVMENFNWPYLKTNITEFWRAWHISLTQLCREYVFTSVHATTRQAWLGVVATMLAVSLWHGFTLNYLAWGLYHAAGITAYRLWSATPAAKQLRQTLPTSLTAVVGWFLTFQFVIVGFVWTKEGTLSASLDAFALLLAEVFGYA